MPAPKSPTSLNTSRNIALAKGVAPAKLDDGAARAIAANSPRPVDPAEGTPHALSSVPRAADPKPF